MLGEKIKTLRTLRGINQLQLANEIGVTKQCISNWENDNILPSIEMLIKLSAYFNVTTDYLLDLEKGKRLIDVQGLSEQQIAHLTLLINDLKS